MAVAYATLDSDVEPCVWAVVESCVAIFCACLPTFPALLHIRSIRASQKPSDDPRSLPSLASDSRRSGYSGSAGSACKELSRKGDWTELPPIERSCAVLHVR